MLRSMTGFGDARGAVEGVEFVVEIRSVNNRYLKVSIRLPDGFSSIESDLESSLRSRLHRGSVTLTVRMKVLGEQGACDVNTAALSRYLEQLRPVVTDPNPMLRIDLGSLLQLPGVCIPPNDELCAKMQQDLRKVIEAATDKLVEMRQDEGEVIAAELKASCDDIEETLSEIARRAPEVVLNYHDRLTSRVAELTNAAQIKLDQDVLAREVAIFADRSDITEEINRLKAHLNQFRRQLESSDPVGRKLDFIAQEMLREANTIGSKGNDSEITKAVVEVKTSVDRIKEQVQNVE